MVATSLRQNNYLPFFFVFNSCLISVIVKFSPFRWMWSEKRQIVIVGSHLSAIERSFEVFHYFIYSVTTLQLFCIFNENHRLCTCPRPYTSLNVKMVKLSIILVFRNLACQLLLTCLYYYKYVRLEKRFLISFASAR